MIHKVSYVLKDEMKSGCYTDFLMFCIQEKRWGVVSQKTMHSIKDMTKVICYT